MDLNELSKGEQVAFKYESYKKAFFGVIEGVETSTIRHGQLKIEVTTSYDQSVPVGKIVYVYASAVIYKTIGSK